MDKVQNNKYCKKFYMENLLEHGNSPLAMGYETMDSQSLSFHIVSGVFTEKDPQVMDIGCGLGHLYYYLKSSGFHPKYYGIDIIREFVGRLKRLGLNVEENDLWKLTRNYDYIVCLGTFGFMNEDEIKNGIRFLFDRTNKSFIFTILYDKISKSKELQIQSKESINQFVSELSSDVTTFDNHPEMIITMRK